MDINNFYHLLSLGAELHSEDQSFKIINGQMTELSQETGQWVKYTGVFLPLSNEENEKYHAE